MSANLRYPTFPFPGISMLASVFGLRPAGRGRWNMPRRVEPTMAPPAPRDEVAEKILERVRTAPNLEMIEWDGDATVDASAPPAPAPAIVEDVGRLDTRRRKIRDRYIAARFPGVARSGEDLADSATVIEAARHGFEDGRPALALELLQLAIAEFPKDPAPALARLELRFLMRDAGAFVADARAFGEAHPGHGAWEEICRLGRAIAPAEPLFGADAGARAHEHYGPWPHLPNWIHAPWDLTAEVCAADFHRALTTP